MFYFMKGILFEKEKENLFFELIQFLYIPFPNYTYWWSSSTLHKPAIYFVLSAWFSFYLCNFCNVLSILPACSLRDNCSF